MMNRKSTSIDPRMSALLAAMWLATACRATTIVAIWTPTAIIVGADSRVAHHTAAGETYTNECKVWTDGPYFFAATGLVGDRLSTFSVRDIGRRSTAGGGTVRQVADRLQETGRRELEPIVGRVMVDDPLLFAGGRPYLEVLVFGYERTATAASVRGFMPPANAATRGMQLSALDWSSSNPLPPGKTGLIVMGERSRIDRYKSATPDWFSQRAAPDSIRQLIMLETISNPRVGGPISIVLVDASGAHWIDRGVCQQ